MKPAFFDGDGNRTFQISRKEAEQYVEKGDTADREENPDTPIAEDGETVGSIAGNSTDTTTSNNDASALNNTEDATRASVNTYYEKVYADPADTIFWYGFGQGMLQFFGNVNTALSAYLSDWFCHAWDYVTGQYKLELHSTTNDIYSGEDVDAMRRAGLSEEEIAEITGGSLDIA